MAFTMEVTDTEKIKNMKQNKDRHDETFKYRNQGKMF